MATRKPKAAESGQVEARALVDLPQHDVAAGALLTADAEIIKGLLDAGLVDDHPEAVAYAKSLEG